MPHWDPGPCGARELVDTYGVDRCRAWVSASEGEGFGYRLRAGNLSGGRHIAAGAICRLTAAPCNTGIRLLQSERSGLLVPGSHTWMREIPSEGYLGLAFDFVGPVGPSDEPVIADLDNWGLYTLREPEAATTILTQDHEDLLFPMTENVVYTDRCGDVTGNGHADLCHRGYTTRVYEGPVTSESEPWMSLTGFGEPGPFGTFGRFGSDGPAVVFGLFRYDHSRGGLGYLPLAQGEHTLQPSDVRFIGQTEGAHTNDGIGTGDFDGDGDVELVLAESFTDERRGAVRVLNDTPDDVFGEVLVELLGRVPFERFGTASLVADLDGDGHQDLVVAAQGSSPIDNPGRVHIFPGPVEQMSWDTAVTWSSGAQHYDAFGWSLEVYDEDGDGDLELFVGAPNFSQVAFWAGAVFSIDDPLRTGR